jgi:hypothetical protein
VLPSPGPVGWAFPPAASEDRRIHTSDAGRMRAAAGARIPASVNRAVTKTDELIGVLRLCQLRRAHDATPAKQARFECIAPPPADRASTAAML